MRHRVCDGYVLAEEFNDTPGLIDATCAHCGWRVQLPRDEPLGALLTRSMQPALYYTRYRFKLPSGRNAIVVRAGSKWSARVWGDKVEG